MELRHLNYFIAVAETENVTRAAAKLHLSQPALSRQIRDLEEELGVELLERSAKSVRLTRAGRKFLLEARAVVKRAAEAVAAVRALAGQAQTELNIGYAPSPTVQILPAALRKFKEAQPAVRVLLHDLSTEQMLAQLAAGKLDLSLTVRPSRALLRGLQFTELARYGWRIAVSPRHRLAQSASLSLEQASQESLIAFNRKDYPDYHEFLDEIFVKPRKRPRIAEQHADVTGFITAVEIGNSVGFVPESMACFAGPRLKLLPFTPEPPPLIVGAVWVKKGLSPTARQFLECAEASSAPPSG